VPKKPLKLFTMLVFNLCIQYSEIKVYLRKRMIYQTFDSKNTRLIFNAVHESKFEKIGFIYGILVYVSPWN
jgi:hypothetical protein